VGRFVRYVWDCGCTRDWSDGTTSAPTKTVQLPGACQACLRRADRARAELRRTYGRAVRAIESRKRKGSR
jgi:hypothetical protein